MGARQDCTLLQVRIPFDSLTLAAVVTDLASCINGKVQRISQLDDFTVVLGIYAEGREAYVLLSCDPEFRVHFVTKRPFNQPQPPQFCSALRSRLDQARLRSVAQQGFDRILDLTFEGSDGLYTLSVELMGKHSNLIFYGEDLKIIGVAKPVGPSKSVRPLMPGRTYSQPPTERKPSLLKAREGDELNGLEGASPFLVKLIQAGFPLEEVKERVHTARFEAVLSPGNGAYPVSVALLGLPEFARPNISVALEQHYSVAVLQYRTRQLKASLLAQLKRVVLAREVAISDLHQAADAAARAGQLQLQGELVLAYGPGLAVGASLLETFDYEGNPLTIKLDAKLDFKENAQKFFVKAKKAKSGQSMVKDQLERLEKDLQELNGYVYKIEGEEGLEQLQELQEAVKARKWVLSQVAYARKEDRPYEGHRIRELIGPGGAAVLYGENATSNDYLTLRVAKPDDYWLHVRGSASAHVVIRTNRQPEKVGPELLMFAAKVAVQNSPSKHSGYVPVDYTLRKYVRKPRGAAAGTALYTQEKTLHVEGD